MILFPKSPHDYPDAAQPAQEVVIDTLKVGDLYPIRKSLGASSQDWRVVLCGRVARQKYGNAIFSSRDAAVEYMKLIAAAFEAV